MLARELWDDDDTAANHLKFNNIYTGIMERIAIFLVGCQLTVPNDHSLMALAAHLVLGCYNRGHHCCGHVVWFHA